MRLHTREWGSGDQVAVLVHGMGASSRAWWRVGPELAGRGYRVIAVDLPGHGGSAPAPDAEPAEFAEALLATVPAKPALALGHSMGGMTLALAVERLLPERAIYSEPLFRVPRLDVLEAFITRDMARTKALSVEQLFAERPQWNDEAKEVEAETIAAWDLDTSVGFLHRLAGRDLAPPAVVPSMIQLAKPSRVLSTAFAAELAERGFEVREVAHPDHTLHYADHEGFMGSLDGWL
ncbi:alpha/beta fold hydrolase [Amycolatopsis sp. NPDC059657]|uniref:alpha/beta fold hydrolase n=1 Tax=Amycolatopsis sp. NPDC059657 TaxID=3346899 RepID=UPI00366FE8DA